MGQAKKRGSQKERIELAQRRKEAVMDRMRRFVQEVHRFSKKTGLELGAVKLDARFCIVKFDELVAFVDRLPVTEAEVLEDLRPREKGEPRIEVTTVGDRRGAPEEMKKHDKCVSGLDHVPSYDHARSRFKDPAHE